MRLYSFVNSYLAGPHIGIQTSHVVARFFRLSGVDYDRALEWDDYDKTIICLNGGDHKSLSELETWFYKDTSYTCTSFEEPGLNFSKTAVGVLVPERVWQLAKYIRNNPDSKHVWKIKDNASWTVTSETSGVFPEKWKMKTGCPDVYWTYLKEDFEVIQRINSSSLAS